MKKYIQILLLFSLSSQSCIKQFLPEVDNSKPFLVVDALITDQNSIYKIKISNSSKLNSKSLISPVKGCLVYITDDRGNKYLFKEKPIGLYQSDSLTFRGAVGEKYILHITLGSQNYESVPMEMKPVPPIDSIYAKIVINDSYTIGQSVPGYQIYIDTHDPLNNCNYYRWDFTETWEFRLPYSYEKILNRVCWKTAWSSNIYIKNTSSLIEDRVSGQKLNFITTETDRLKVKYSIGVRQFSMNQLEYNYWDKLKRITENVGGLYDVVPMSVDGNMYCSDNPDEKVLGFFSVSSVFTKRLFIKNTLTGFPDFYRKCPTDTVPASQQIPNLNIYTFIIERLNDFPPTFGTFYVLTNKKECTDCSLTGSKVIPPFWNETKSDFVINSALK